jgi:transposase
MWVPPEETDPVLLHAPTRKSVALFGAVNLRQGQLVTQAEPTFDGLSFGRFLRHLLRHRARGRRLVLILDNASYHHARLLKPFWRQQRRVLRLDYLPPYSPELNPIERVWKLARRLCTHNQYFPELQDLIDAVSRQMAAWRKPNVTLRRLCGIT